LLKLRLRRPSSSRRGVAVEFLGSPFLGSTPGAGECPRDHENDQKSDAVAARELREAGYLEPGDVLHPAFNSNNYHTGSVSPLCAPGADGEAAAHPGADMDQFEAPTATAPSAQKTRVATRTKVAAVCGPGRDSPFPRRRGGQHRQDAGAGGRVDNREEKSDDSQRRKNLISEAIAFDPRCWWLIDPESGQLSRPGIRSGRSREAASVSGLQREARQGATTHSGRGSHGHTE
jgi:hypothetical protein